MIAPRQLLVLCLLAAACAPGEDGGEACAGATPPAIGAPQIDLQDPEVSRHNLRAWVELLAAPELRGRHAGERGARHAAALLAAEMARLGLAPPPGGGYCQGFPFLGGEDFNVVGRLPAAPADGRPALLVSAHYDGQGVHPAGMVYPGADDNASGVAALLEVARLAARRSTGASAPAEPAASLAWIFVAFGAEEGGQQGARAYLAEPRAVPSRLELAVNLDMVGRALPGERSDAIGYLAPGGAPPAALGRLRAAALGSRIEIRSLQEAGERMPALTDAEVLATRLPTLLLSTGLHEDHHRPTDTTERIDYRQIERAARLVLGLGDIIAAL